MSDDKLEDLGNSPTMSTKTWDEVEKPLKVLQEGTEELLQFGKTVEELHTTLGTQKSELERGDKQEGEDEVFEDFLKGVDVEGLQSSLKSSQDKLQQAIKIFESVSGDKGYPLLEGEFPEITVEVDKALEKSKEISEKIKETEESLKEALKSDSYQSCPYGPTMAKGLFGVMSTVAPLVNGVSSIFGYVTTAFSYFDTDGPLERVVGSRELALSVLESVSGQDVVTTAAVAKYAVEPFFKTAGNMASGRIGKHYEEIKDGLLSAPPTDKNLELLATNETVNFWNKEPGLAGWVGSLMSKESRFEILKKCRDEQWLESLDSEALERWNKAKDT